MATGARALPWVGSKSRTTRFRLEPLGWWATSLPLVGLLVLPLVALLTRTPPATIIESLAQTSTQQAISLSIVTSLTSLVIVLCCGTPLAYLLANQRGRLLPFVEVLVDLPTVLPPAVAGIALLMAFGRRGMIGASLADAGIEIAFTRIAVVLAQCFVAAPYYVKSAAVGLASVSRELEQAAALDGATPTQVFRFIVLPLARRGIVSGLALCWARALGEFGATIIFAGNFPGRTQTMPLAIYLGFEIDLGQALTLASIMLAVSFTILLSIRAALRPQANEE